MSKKFYDLPLAVRTEDAYAAEDLIRRERWAWNNLKWQEMAECYAVPGTLKFHLYTGDAHAYCEEKAKAEKTPKDLYLQPATDIRGIRMWQNENKMVAEVPAVITSLHTVSGIEYKLESRVRLYYSLVKQEGAWKIARLAPLYEQDSLQPTLPVAAPLAAPEEFQKLHAAHKGFSWLMAKAGTPVGRMGLAGVDRPLLMTEFYEEISVWFFQDKIMQRPQVRLSGEELMRRVKRIGELEKIEAPALEQDGPRDVTEIYQGLLEDYEATSNIYFEKRIVVSGTVCKIGPDTYGAPAIELGSDADSRCHALCVFHKPGQKEQSEQLALGQKVVLRGNVINFMEPYGAVIKNIELLEPDIPISAEQSL